MIYIAGASSQLGQEIKKSGLFSGAIFLEKNDLDLSKLDSLEKFLNTKKIKTFINAAAYTNVDRAELEKSLSSLVNSHAPSLIAQYAEEKKFKFIHFSTDYVFDGEIKEPRTEISATHPINHYGQSKLDGENSILKINSHALIIRTSWLYSSFGNNFVKTILKLANERSYLAVIDDQTGCPTLATDLIKATKLGHEQDLKGIYHFSNEGKTTWHNFAETILKLKRVKTPVKAIKSSELITQAIRPKYSVLDKTKIKTHLNIQIRPWTEALQEFLKDFS